MALEDRTRRRTATAVPEQTGLFGDREDTLVVVAGVLITAGVLYDVYRRQSRDRPR
ncbi:hypothetical protein [Halorussus salinus]|uniref:hypothetical protein n=1 Tax=Halorussus salinus TaxID=1364935 RepID=UPI00138F3F5F|nr:hypothetical protein [Halorussus salinus]